MKKLVWWVALCLLVAFSVGLPLALGEEKREEQTNNPSMVLVLWHVDSFEGGTGSRQEFLMKTAVQFEKENEGVYVSVIKHTEESVKENLSRGIVPDMISFGCGVYGVDKYAKPLKSHKNNLFFNSCEYGGRAYCYPYAYGVYALFTGEGGSGVAASRGRNNLVLFSALLSGREWTDVKEPMECYTGFVLGKWKNMIGTQRDAYRLLRRGASFECEAMGDFTDLVQYIAVTAEDGKRSDASARFAEFLVEEKTQKRLNEIGLFSPLGVSCEYGDEVITRLARTKITRVLPPFIDENERVALVKADGQNNFFEKFKNYLKD